MIRRAVIMMMCVGMFMGVNADDDDEDELEAIKIDSAAQIPEEQRLGGSGVVEIGLINLNLEPIKKIVKEDLDKGGFNFDNNTFSTIGVIGYAGQRRNGIRIGCGGWVGYNSIYSDKWTSHADSAALENGSDSLVDSIIQLHLAFAHMGLVVEKSFAVAKNVNIYAGGLIGGGALLAIEDRKLGGTAFSTVDTGHAEKDHDEDADDIRAALAPVWALDIHGGITYSVTKWLHLGIDGTALMYYSSSGFQPKYGSFWTFNPGVKLRFIFGTSV